MHRDHVAHTFVQQREARFVASVRAELAAEYQAGRLREGLDLDMIARLITAQIEGIQPAWLGDPSVDVAVHLAALTDRIRKTVDG